ncbi:MAG: ligD [Myxococcaceae bacterium]|nr:ligD [Myxococcaceae bacterium]
MVAKRSAKRQVAAPPPASEIDVQLATLVDRAPSSDEWLHEIKLDGYRIVARVEAGATELTTRNGNDWTHRAPNVVEALNALPIKNAVFDGEVVSLREDGVSDFQSLQNALSEGRDHKLVYFVFDLLFLDGNDLRSLPLTERKAALETLFAAVDSSPALRYSAHVTGGGPAFFEHACKLKLEGSIAKRASAPYRAGRSKDWLKIKCIARQEFVIGGYTPPAGTRTHLGALLMGVQEGDALRYTGKVGTGFTQQSLRDLHKRLAPLVQPSSPFADTLKGAAFRGARWVKPVLVAEIAFSEFTQGGHLRHPSFQGLREDKPASAVVRETPVHQEKPARKSQAKKSERQGT